MQAIILAAGRGTRLGALTDHCPKTLIPLNGKPILEHVLRSLPASVTEVVLVVGYRADMICERFDEQFESLPLKYVELKELHGTADALWNARPLIGEDPFLVLQGDDVHVRDDLERMIEYPLALGTYRTVVPHGTFLSIDTDPAGNLVGSHRPTIEEAAAGIPMATGAYMLDSRIFTYEPVRIANGEYGLPQTIFAMAKEHPVRAFPMRFWASVNAPEDIARAEEAIQQASQ